VFKKQKDKASSELCMSQLDFLTNFKIMLLIFSPSPEELQRFGKKRWFPIFRKKNKNFKNCVAM